MDLCLGGDEGSMSLTLKWRWHEKSATQVPQGLQQGHYPQAAGGPVGLNPNVYKGGRQLVKQPFKPATEKPPQATSDSMSQELSGL